MGKNNLVQVNQGTATQVVISFKHITELPYRKKLLLE